MVFTTLTPLVLVPLSVLGCSLVLAKENAEATSLQTDNPSHRSKRWIWGGCGLIPSCERCDDGLICKQCSQVFLPVEYLRGRTRMIRCIRECPEGYNVSSTGEYPKICVRVQLGCQVRNCDDCHPLNPVSCANCSSEFYSLQKRVMGVVKCVRQCPIGYTPFVRHDGRKMCKDSHIKCQATVPHCAKCLDSQRCQKCKNNFLAFLNKTSMICLRSCPAGFIEADTGFFGRYCKKPREVCRSVRNCDRCPDQVNCRRCKPNYFKIKLFAFSNATCVSVCPPGFQVKGRRCQRILEGGCVDEYCLTCKVGWYRVNHNNKHCLRQCPSGYYPRGSQQKFCSRCVQDCESCSNDQDCIKCKPGTTRLAEESRVACVKSCPSGYSSQGDDKTGHVCLPQRIT